MGTVVVLGAGATKACGGPMTDEILPIAFLRRAEIAPEPLGLVRDFLAKFGVSKKTLDLTASDAPDDINELVKRCKPQYPGLPLLLSLLDTAIHRNEAFGPSWPVRDLRRVRASIEAVVFEIIEVMVRDPQPLHARLLEKVGKLGEPGAPTFISLNYDLLIDYALMQASQGHFPDYGIDIDSKAYRESPGTRADGRRATLLKIHGSLNWLYCPACHRLDVGLTESAPATLPPIGDVMRMRPQPEEGCTAVLAGDTCATRMQHVLITPSHRKDYRNPHITRLWISAEGALRAADKVVLIGYSLPWDDVEVIYLLRRGTAHLKPSQITVLERGGEIHEHEAGKRYRAIFGEVGWLAGDNGFKAWIDG